MNWYYVEAGQQMGPVDDAGLSALVASGKINVDTLVWREGMANWQAYREIQPGGARVAAAQVPAGRAVSGGGEAVCAECGGIFPINDTIQIGAARVCANCKPVFMQKMREGVDVGASGSLRYAGFWIRFAAKFIDGICLLLLVFVPLFILGMVIAVGSAQGNPQQARETGRLIGGVAQVFALGINILYSGFFLGKFGATPGKMLCRLKVVDSTGDRISFGRAFVRPCAEILSGMICYIGYIMAGFDSEKRALHDRLCNTRVVFK